MMKTKTETGFMRIKGNKGWGKLSSNSGIYGFVSINNAIIFDAKSLQTDDDGIPINTGLIRSPIFENSRTVRVIRTTITTIQD